MAKLALVKASTDVSVYVFAQDSSVTTGAGLTGLAYNTASLSCYYVRPGGSATAISLVTQTVTGAHSDGGFVEVDSTNMPGVYRLDLPDAVLASGVDSVVVMLHGATNLTPIPLEIQLTDLDLNTDTLDLTIVDTYTFQDVLKIMAGVLAGKVTGGGTTSVTFRGLDDASDIVVATVDADGNRSAVTITV